ncbi:MAG: hypothetical protein IJ566_02460, partial [Cardiobacteriaceae bacterium]|nr:hypothetical protein [Cardiobacteriaceae bacterium]
HKKPTAISAWATSCPPYCSTAATGRFFAPLKMTEDADIDAKNKKSAEIKRRICFANKYK